MTTAMPNEQPERQFPRSRLNFWCHVAEGGLSMLGGMMVTGQVVFSVLATTMGATPVALGLLISLGQASFIAALLAAPALEAVRRKKRLILFLGIGQRLPLLLAAVALLLLGRTAPTACLIVLACLVLCRNLASSLVGPAWLDLLAETLPRERLGRVFGFRQSLTSLMGLAAGPACGAIIASLAFPHNFALLYLSGFVVLVVSWVIFAQVNEVPDDAPAKPPARARHYFRELLPALRRDAPFRSYMVFRGLLRLGVAVRPFYFAAHVARFGVSPGLVAASFLVASSAAKILGNALYPFLAERVGYKRVLALGALLRAAGAALAAAAPSGSWFVAVYFLDGAAVAANTSTGSPFMLGLVPRERRVGYATLQMAVMAGVGILALPLAGLAMQTLGLMVLFALAAVLLVAALVPLSRARPAFHGAEEAEA